MTRAAVLVHVVGAGIGGSAAALALHGVGARVVVHEAHPHSSADAGAFLTLAENGVRALRAIGADDAVRRASAPLRTMRVSDGAGAEITSRPLGEPGGPGFRYLTRARLCAVLQDEVRRRGIPLRHGERLTGIERDGDGVVAVFDDGGRARGDLLVGADGLRSTVRTQLDPAAAPPRYVGSQIFYGSTPGTPPGAPTDRIQFVRSTSTGSVAFGFIATERDGTWWFARVVGPELAPQQVATGTTGDWSALLTDVLREEPLPRSIVAGADRVLVTNAFDLANVRVWHRDRALIIGDAAHAASPATGQGASMALEDAVALAGAIRDGAGTDGGGIDAALGRYEERRRPPVEANTAASARM
ncbi:FAD-dependent oxidoreductase [Pseudonocardia adelaidensis]|uniref:FAD-dependent monooxygenase n=1 Tax=Pseudonocardia adelaidensis TaxID=648754 RepID=A0ABP9NS98_9PSEU